MKKLISLAVAFIVASVMSVTAFASGTTWTPGTGAVKDFESNPAKVPMFGYVGPYVDEIDDPDPEDPTINPWKISISVPVKFMWAAFEPTSGLVAPVESPNYQIINRGDRDIKVSVIGFEETADPLDSMLGSVELYFTSAAANPVAFDEEIDFSGVIDSLNPVVLGVITKQVADVPTEWNFGITGEYTAITVWPDEIQLPEYEVVFQFRINR